MQRPELTIKQLEGKIKNPRLSNTKTLKAVRHYLQSLNGREVSEQELAGLEAMRELSLQLRPGMLNTHARQMMKAHRHCAEIQRHLLMNECEMPPAANPDVI